MIYGLILNISFRLTRNQSSEGRNLKSAAKTPAKEVISAKKSLPPTSEKYQFFFN